MMKRFVIFVIAQFIGFTLDQVCALSTARANVAVIGGGASGMFAATNAASTLRKHGLDSELCEVHVFEATSRLMSKVAISGGGRCNVLHDTTTALPKILNSYPRGFRELNGLYSKHFTPEDAREWFVDRGVVLKTESDGRMFPVTDTSQTIIDCIYDDAMKNGVVIKSGNRVLEVQMNDSDNGNGDFSSFNVITQKRGKSNKEEDQGIELETLQYDCIIMATGSSPKGHEIVKDLGHKIVQPVPSLFTLNVAKSQIKEYGSVLNGLSGLSLQNSRLTLKVPVPGKKKKKTLIQEGPLLITHAGISGPATLRLSAFAAREFNAIKYQTNVIINWAPEFALKVEDIENQLWSFTTMSPKKLVASACPLRRQSSGTDVSSSTIIPRRLWSNLAISSGFEKDTIWAEASKKKVGRLARNIVEFNLEVTGKSVFKDEFVTAGGVMLKEITMKTMESKKCPGLYFCGEVIDVDGVTGGFNFMNCWSTGFTAGSNSAMRLVDQIENTR